MTIKELRESKGLSQGKFADSIGIGRTAIVGYEKGKFKWNMKKERFWQHFSCYSRCLRLIVRHRRRRVRTR